MFYVSISRLEPSMPRAFFSFFAAAGATTVSACCSRPALVPRLGLGFWVRHSNSDHKTILYDEHHGHDGGAGGPPNVRSTQQARQLENIFLCLVTPNSETSTHAIAMQVPQSRQHTHTHTSTHTTDCMQQLKIGELMRWRKSGPPQGRRPSSEAKERLGRMTAGDEAVCGLAIGADPTQGVVLAAAAGGQRVQTATSDI